MEENLENQSEEQEKEEYNLLCTRSAEYQKFNPREEKCSTSKSKASNRGTQILVCEEHTTTSKPWVWSKESSDCKNCINFNKYTGQFSQGKLPTQEQVISHTILLIENDEGHSTPVYRRVAMDLCLHWIYCNVYTQSIHKVAEKVRMLHENYKSVKRNPVKKRGKTFWEKYHLLISKCETIFDIKASDERSKRQEKIWDVKMVEDDRTFYLNQCKVPQVGHCSTFVSRKWSTTQKRKVEKEEQYKKQMERKEEYERSLVPLTEIDNADEDEEDMVPSDDDNFVTIKKAKYSYNPHVNRDSDDDMPYKYRHIRSGLRSVRPEYYTLIHRLTSTYHMSRRQAQGAVVEVANFLFDRNWKTYNKEEVIDNDTLPAQENINRTEPYIEAMALAAIVEEIMLSEESVIVYSNDGTSMNKVGSYVVQSFSIGGKQRALPTLPVFTEDRETLQDLEIATLKMLSAATGYKYSEKEILEKVDFVMTDSTSHNIGVIEAVCEELEVSTDKIPKSLVCNVHPLMMLQRVMKALFTEIHDGLGNAKIKDCFMVDVEFANESFVIKAIKCLTSFINRDCCAKPWNRESHFNAFIAPKQNFSLILKDHRFNRLFECCTTLLYHLDDIKSYLEKYASILNSIAILDRSFLEMTILKPIFCATALIGFHVARPFLNLVLDTETTYDILRVAFPLIYHELCTIDTNKLLQVENQVFMFVSRSLFEVFMPEKCIKDALVECIEQYPTEIKQLLDIVLPRLASGFSTQRGSLFGFGPEADSDTGTLLKVCSVEAEEERKKLNQAPIHNLAEERGVGFINYELDIRGKANLKSASTKMILNKSFDLVARQKDTLRKFIRPAKVIKEMKLEWNEKMKKCEEAGFEKKEVTNLSQDNAKLELLQVLKNETIPGPFTTEEDVKEFMLQPESKEKNLRLYNEVRYARLTSLSLKPTASVFRLKKNYKNYKNLDSSEYAQNLISYFGSVRSCTTLTTKDLNNVLRGLLLQQSDNEPEKASASEPNVPDFIIGSHVATLWIEGNTSVWYLGTIESIGDSGEIMVSYTKRVNNGDIEWVYPEEADIWETKREQILLKNVAVKYRCSVQIRLTLTAHEQLTTIKELLNQYQLIM